MKKTQYRLQATLADTVEVEKRLLTIIARARKAVIVGPLHTINALETCDRQLGEIIEVLAIESDGTS